MISYYALRVAFVTTAALVVPLIGYSIIGHRRLPASLPPLAVAFVVALPAIATFIIAAVVYR